MDLDELDRRLKKSFREVFIETMDTPRMKSLIISLIQDRLKKRGTDSYEAPLRTDASIEQNLHPFYSLFTAKMKEEAGQISDHVTLEDTGNFYDSMFITIKKTFINIKANYKKEDGNIYDNFTDSYTNFKAFDEFVLNITDKDVDTITQALLPKLIENVRREYFGL